MKYVENLNIQKEKEVIKVTENFVKEVTTIGDINEDSVSEFLNRIEYNKKNREYSAENAMQYVSSDSVTFNPDKIGSVSDNAYYSGALVKQKHKETSITNVEHNDDVVVVTFNVTVEEYVTYLVADESGKNDENGNPIVPYTEETTTKIPVGVGKKTITLKDLKITLVKENDTWKVLNGKNTESKAAQYFSMWQGTSKIIEDTGSYKTIKERTYEL